MGGVFKAPYFPVTLEVTIMPHNIAAGDTATMPVTPSRSITAAPINYRADWRVISEKAGEVVMTDILRDLALPETIRIASAEIADIFKGSPIEAPVVLGGTGSAIKKGISILIQLNGISTITNGTSQDGYPFQAHLVLKIPLGGRQETITAANIDSIVGRLLGHLYSTGEGSTTNRLEALLRGSLVPTDL